MADVVFNAEILKKIRNHRGVSLRQMEERSGISNAYLSQLETGKVKNPSLDVLYKLSQYFDLPMDIFVVDVFFDRIKYGKTLGKVAEPKKGE